MDPVHELIDENKEQLPVGLFKKLVDTCKAEQDARAKLLKVTVTRVTGHYTYSDDVDDPCMLNSVTLRLILEEVDNSNRQSGASGMNDAEMLLNGMYPKQQNKPSSLPRVFTNGLAEQYIIHSIEPFVGWKRGREE